MKSAVLDGSIVYRRSKVSLWLRDLCIIGEYVGLSSNLNWFSSSISCNLGNGYSLDFWRHRWFGSTPLERQFPFLFSLFAEDNHRVCDMGDWINESWR